MAIAGLVAKLHHPSTTTELIPLRYLLGLILLIFLGAVGLFAVQNTQPITVKFWNWEMTAPVALMAICSYLLGMISGWNVVAFLRSSIRRVRSHPPGESKGQF